MSARNAQRRTILKTLLAAPILGYANVLRADNYPTRPIKFIVPFAGGGVTDIQARVISPELGRILGQPLVVENRGGASGEIGNQATMRSPADGYTILLSTVSLLCTNPHIHKLPYDSLVDLTPISRLSTVENLFVVNPKLPIHNIQDLIAYSKTKPGGVSFGSGGTGGSLHLTGELLRSMSDLRFTHIPYQGTAPAEVNLMSGEIDLIVTSLAASMPNIQAGRMRAIAATRDRRYPRLPDVPTVSESGVPGFTADSWISVHGPKNLPPEIVQKLDAAIGEVVAQPAIREQFAKLGLQTFYAPSETLRAYQEAENKKWGQVIKSLNLSTS